MRKTRHMLLDGSKGAFRPAVALRSGVEAVLLAAVALGCAQAGWSILTPDRAGASAGGRDEPNPTPIPAASVRSPFAPAYAESDVNSAAASMLASVRLEGVRMALEPAMSGAYFTLADGQQHAFSVGQEIAPGVRLSDVRADHVVVSYAGGEQQIAMPAPTQYSFALAMMGRAQDGAQIENASFAEAAHDLRDVPLATSAPAAEGAWLASAFSHVEASSDGVAGWRLSGQMPAAASAAGLREGDLILAVNGVRPGDASALLAAVSTGRVTLDVRRADGQTITIHMDVAQPT